jgi:hypothetical protein
MNKTITRFVLLLLSGCLAAGVSQAQFGGRAGDVVVEIVNSKGSAKFLPASASTPNSPTNALTMTDPLTLPPQQFGPDFPGESRRLLHSETGDNFMMIVQKEGIISPHQMFQDAAKVLIVSGMLRLLPLNGTPIDATATLFSPFPKTLDFGPDQPLIQELSFLWTASPLFPVVVKADPSYISPNNPPGLTGIEYLVNELASVVTLIPWTSVSTAYPGQGWQQGIDQKIIDVDSSLGSSVQIVRLRPGRQTPAFKIGANTHIAVLQGSLTIAPTGGGTPLVLTPFQYTFVPNGFSVVMSNPIPYTGPTSVTVPGH